MPVRRMDEEPLGAMAEILREIANVLENLSKAAGRAEEGEGHVDPFVRINGSLADIREVMKGLNTPGDHSAEYAQIERSFRAIAAAVKDLASGSPPSK
jgi:hypothetical protein